MRKSQTTGQHEMEKVVGFIQFTHKGKLREIREFFGTRS